MSTIIAMTIYGGKSNPPTQVAISKGILVTARNFPKTTAPPY